MHSRIARRSVLGLVAALALTAPVLAQAEEAEDLGWSGEVAAAFTAQTGSVDTIAGNLDAKTERTWPKDVASIRFNGTYGRSRDRGDTPSKDTTLQNSQALYGDYKHLYTDRFFWEAANELSRDPTQDREVRARIATGPGYRFWQGEDRRREFFDGKAGAGYRYELFDGNTGGTRDENGYDSHFADAIVAAEYRNLFFDGRVEWTHTASFSMPVNDTAAWLARTEAIAGIPLTEAWSFRTTFLFEWNNNAPDDQNEALTRTTVGLGYKF